jgi:hypothetical protein
MAEPFREPFATAKVIIFFYSDKEKQKNPLKADFFIEKKRVLFSFNGNDSNY